MQASQIPTKISVLWASSAAGGNIRPIPITTVDPNAASYTLGWPPNTLKPIGAGGSPPDGRDDNGINNAITAWLQWQSMGVFNPWDTTFASTIGGYPKGAIVASTSVANLLYVSTADNNLNNPDAVGAPVNWLPFYLPKKASTFIQKTAPGSGNVTPSDRTVLFWRGRMSAGGGGAAAPNLSANGQTGGTTSLRDWSCIGGGPGTTNAGGGAGGSGGANGTGTLIARVSGMPGSIGGQNNNVGGANFSISFACMGGSAVLSGYGTGGQGQGTLDQSGSHTFVPGAGGGAEYVEFLMPVTFGTNYAYVVGAGGLCGDGFGTIRSGTQGVIFIEEIYG